MLDYYNYNVAVCYQVVNLFILQRDKLCMRGFFIAVNFYSLISEIFVIYEGVWGELSLHLICMASFAINQLTKKVSVHELMLHKK